MMKSPYQLNKSIRFECGFELSADNVQQAIIQSNEVLRQLPASLFRSVDYKTTSAMIGCILCENIAILSNGVAVVNPIEKGHPDIVPIAAVGSSEEILKNYPQGLEVKCTVGGLPKGSDLEKAISRIGLLNSITWEAHHQEVNELLGITYDYFTSDSGNKPIITGAFYSSQLCRDDWGKISGTEGRNTKVTRMLKSGKTKMGRGWFAILNDERYTEKYSQILKFRVNGE